MHLDGRRCSVNKNCIIQGKFARILFKPACHCILVHGILIKRCLGMQHIISEETNVLIIATLVEFEIWSFLRYFRF